MIQSALLVLEDGTKFIGRAIGAIGITSGEIVFNTSMTGYQEILTDPSYFCQIVIFTYPHIGNVGINDEDNESSQVQVRGLIIRDLPLIASNFRYKFSLSDYLIRHNIIGIADVDTRKITRLIRETGPKNGCIISGNKLNTKIALHQAKICPDLSKIDLIQQVSTKKKYCWTHNNFNFKYQPCTLNKNHYAYRIIAYDFGIKYNIMRILAKYCHCLIVVPAHTSAYEVLKMYPDGIFLSNGPGNPAYYDYAINNVKIFLNKNIPIFGICLGYQLLALASGAKTIKMKCGHHGNNHPVKDLIHGNIMITVQNHNFTIDKTTLPNLLKITHISLFDDSLQGIHRTDKPAFGFQGHPEASPGPHDAILLFDHFIELIHEYHTTYKIADHVSCQKEMI